MEKCSNKLSLIVSDFELIKKDETIILSLVKNNNVISGGLFHRLSNPLLTSSMSLTKKEHLYLIVRLLFIYSKTKKINKQIQSIELRKMHLQNVFIILYKQVYDDIDISYDDLIKILFCNIFK